MLGNEVQAITKTRAPGQHAFGVKPAHVIIEQLVLIGERQVATSKKLLNRLSGFLDDIHDVLQFRMHKSCAASRNLSLSI